MQSVLDAPEALDSEVHDLPEAQPRIRPDHAGFWQRVVQYLRRHRVHRGRYTPSSHRSVHPCEAPVDLLARQYPTLCIQAYAGI